MIHRTHIPQLIAAAVLICGGLAIADQVGFADAGPEQRQNVAAHTPKPSLQVGARLDPQMVHWVSRPGLYGISQSPTGSAYGVVEGRLIRFDPESLQVQSVIRPVERILD